jgi:hypothetical protein
VTTYQGIAVVTQALRLIASDALRTTVPGAHVTLDRPEEAPAAGRDEPRLNIYLVQAGIDPLLRNNDLPTRSSNGSLRAVPQVPVTLRYLFSYFGPSLQAHLMLGAIEVALHESPELDPALIAQVERQEGLKGAGLDTQEPRVRIVPAALSLETLSRFWSGFLQTPYTLSTVHDVSPVLLSSGLTPSAELPVRTVGAGVGGLPPQLDPLAPVSYAPGTVVPVSGPGVEPGQYVEIDGEWAEITAGPGGGLGFPLPDNVVAGRRQAQLGAPPPGGGSPTAIPGASPRVIEVRPEILSLAWDGEQIQVELAPAAEPGQTVGLTIYPVALGSGPPGLSATVSTSVTEPTTELAFPLPTKPSPTLPAGQYLAIVSVDNVASMPEFAGGAYSGPLVEVT